MRCVGVWGGGICTPYHLGHNSITTPFRHQGWVDNFPEEPNFVVPDSLKKMIAENKLGRKTGQGYYKWDSPGDTKPLLTSNFLVHNGVDLEVAFASGEAWGGGRPVNTTAIAQLAGTPVVLVLRMQDCKLYGLQFQ